MSISIPPAGGIPGISGPPDWLSALPTRSFDLYDVRWLGAIQRSFGAGGAGSNSFRAAQAVVAGKQFIYLSFHAAFVPSLSDQYDSVLLGLQRTGGTNAMVVQMQLHGPTFTPAGPPSANPPALASVQIWTRTNTDTSWTLQNTSPSWIATNARVWLHSASDVPPDPNVPLDPNNRWAIELLIPAAISGDIAADGGPNVGTDFALWYYMRGTAVGDHPVILADSRTSGLTTQGQLENGLFPIPFGMPSLWDEYVLTSVAGTNGGVAIFGNGYSDIVVQNVYGEGTTIQYGAANTFVARPRNYTGQKISAGNISATFRLADWGSVAGDPNQVNWASGIWDYVPGNSALNPVVSSLDIPAISAGNNPPPTTNPISLSAAMTLASGKSLHQCVLVTLTGANLTFLNDSAFQNMNFDHASLLERNAKISIVGLKAFSRKPRKVYLALEKINMPAQTPPGTNEGQFLQASMTRLINQGGPLGQKLKWVQDQLAQAGDFGSKARLDLLFKELLVILSKVNTRDPAQAEAALERLQPLLARWLTNLKTQKPDAARLMGAMFDGLGAFLNPGDADAKSKLPAATEALTQWLATIGSDTVSVELLPGTIDALVAWTSLMATDHGLSAALKGLADWLTQGHPAAGAAGVVAQIVKVLLAVAAGGLTTAIGALFQAGANWLKGYERLDTFVQILGDAGVATNELDQLFPTCRVHVYYDTGERVTGRDGKQHPVLREQSSFGIYAYHEGPLVGWQTSIQGATRIAHNWYRLSVPNKGTAKITKRIQAHSRVHPDATKGK